MESRPSVAVGKRETVVLTPETLKRSEKTKISPTRFKKSRLGQKRKAKRRRRFRRRPSRWFASRRKFKSSIFKRKIQTLRFLVSPFINLYIGKEKTSRTAKVRKETVSDILRQNETSKSLPFPQTSRQYLLFYKTLRPSRSSFEIRAKISRPTLLNVVCPSSRRSGALN